MDRRSFHASPAVSAAKESTASRTAKSAPAAKGAARGKQAVAEREPGFTTLQRAGFKTIRSKHAKRVAKGR